MEGAERFSEAADLTLIWENFVRLNRNSTAWVS